MTFLEALKTRRPMRRTSDFSCDPPWLHLGNSCSGLTGRSKPQWRRIDTGAEVGLHIWDYEADDWEVLP